MSLRFQVHGLICEVTPEERLQADTIIKGITGTAADPDEWVNSYNENRPESEWLTFSLSVSRWLDYKIAACEDCEHWTPNQDLKDGLCTPCRPCPE